MATNRNTSVTNDLHCIISHSYLKRNQHGLCLQLNHCSSAGSDLVISKSHNTCSIWSKMYHFYSVLLVIDIPALKLLTEFQGSGNCVSTFREDVFSASNDNNRELKERSALKEKQSTSCNSRPSTNEIVKKKTLTLREYAVPTTDSI